MTNLNHPSLMPSRRISAEEFAAIQASHREDVENMLSRAAYVAREYTTAEDRESCSSCKGQCSTPAACGRDEDDDSEFGALEGLTRGMPYIVGAWGVVAVILAAAWISWPWWWPL